MIALWRQESLAMANVSARQPWYIWRSSLNRPSLRNAKQYQRHLYTSLKSAFSAQQLRRWQCGSIVIRLAVVASQTCEVAQHSEKIRSSKIDDFGTNRKRICDFLLVINSNSLIVTFVLSCIVSEIGLYRTANYWLKIAYSSYPSLIRRPRSLSSLGISRWS